MFYLFAIGYLVIQQFYQRKTYMVHFNFIFSALCVRFDVERRARAILFTVAGWNRASLLVEKWDSLDRRRALLGRCDLPIFLRPMAPRVEPWCLRGEGLADFSGDSGVRRVAIPWVRRTRPMVRADLKLMELIVVERLESVVHGSVAKRNERRVMN